MLVKRDGWNEREMERERERERETESEFVLRDIRERKGSPWKVPAGGRLSGPYATCCHALEAHCNALSWAERCVCVCVCVCVCAWDEGDVRVWDRGSAQNSIQSVCVCVCVR